MALGPSCGSSGGSGDTMADRVVLVLAANGGRTVAGALNLVGGDHAPFRKG